MNSEMTIYVLTKLPKYDIMSALFIIMTMVDSFEQSRQTKAERAFRLQKFRVAFDIYRAVAFFSAVLVDGKEFCGDIHDAVDFAREVILRAAPYLRADQREYFINYVSVLFVRSEQPLGDYRKQFRNLRRIARRVIAILGIDEEELKSELREYWDVKAQAQALHLGVLSEFLYEKKVLPDSRFDSAQKMEIHRMSKEMSNDELRAVPLYGEYMRFRDENKLRINSIASVLGALEDLLEISDVQNRIRTPLLERIRELNKRIVDTVSTAQTIDAIDTETFDVDQYIAIRFTPKYETQRKGVDMAIECVTDTETLTHDILDILFPSIMHINRASRQQILDSLARIHPPQDDRVVPRLLSQDAQD